MCIETFVFASEARQLGRSCRPAFVGLLCMCRHRNEEMVPVLVHVEYVKLG